MVAFDSSLHLKDNKHHLLLCASGSVATIKISNIIQALSSHRNLSIRLIFTTSATSFLAGQSSEQPSLSAIEKMPNVDGVYFDADEWSTPWTRGAKILHIELRRWGDLMVVAPLSADSLAKMVNGISDNLLQSTMRAWDTTGILDFPHIVTTPGNPVPSTLEEDTQRKKIIVVAPAMNTAMWVHPVTQKHMDLLENDWNVKNGGWVDVLRPMEKELACGDVGTGAMKDWRDIVRHIQGILHLDSNPTTNAP